MNKKTKEFISQNPFTSIFGFLGALIGLLIASQTKLNELVYLSILQNSESIFGEGFQDPTGGLISGVLIILPVSVIIFLLCALIGGVFFAIFGHFIDKENKKFKEGEKNLFDRLKDDMERQSLTRKKYYDPYLGRTVYSN